MNTRLLRGSQAEHRVAFDLVRRGYGVAWPSSPGHPFDLVLIRPDHRLERVQVKCACSDGEVVAVKCASTSDWVQYSYSSDMVDWIAVWDETTDACYYLRADDAARREVRLRLTPPKNGQVEKVRWAADHRSI